MPQQAWSDKRERQYEHIKEGLERAGHLGGQGRGDRRADGEQGAGAGRRGEGRRRGSRARDISSGRRGGLRSGTRRAKGRTRDQLYEEAKDMGIEGRSKMNKAQLQRAVDRRK